MSTLTAFSSHLLPMVTFSLGTTNPGPDAGSVVGLIIIGAFFLAILGLIAYGLVMYSFVALYLLSPLIAIIGLGVLIAGLATGSASLVEGGAVCLVGGLFLWLLPRLRE